MESKDNRTSARNNVIVLEKVSPAEVSLPPWLFRHIDLSKAIISARSIEKDKLTNIINYLHFKGEQIYVLLKHPLYEEMIMVPACPEPCLGEELKCRLDRKYSGYNLEHYRFQYLIISHQQSVIVVSASLLASDSECLIVKLPEQSHDINERQTLRFTCRDVKAELWQSGFQAVGELVDYSATAFRIRVQPAPPSSFHWFNAEVPAMVRLSGGRDVFFSGNCTSIHQKKKGRDREIVLAPRQTHIKRFPARVLRNPRRQISPPLYAMFEHPFIAKRLQREIFDISTSGLSTLVKPDEVVLMPGMIVPDMQISYAGILKIRCKTQVIYRKDDRDSIRFGMAILDMDLTSYNRLTQLLNNVPGADAGMTNLIDLEELWDLFFDTDFIYPRKYKHIQSFRKDFQETYRKLYEDNPDIAKHFTYQKNGRIYSHVSIIRAYERAWMIHHHAARPLQERYTGFVVLKQLIYYLNGVHHLPSAHMDYVFCYVRPENKYNERLYTGFTQETGNAQVTSLDLFGYLTYETKDRPGPLPRGWSLREATASDLWESEQFYSHHSGGLLWHMLSLDDPVEEESLEAAYAQAGFVRRWKAWALNFEGRLKALIIAEESDVAINLSDLLNGFKVIITDPSLPSEILLSAVGSMLSSSPIESCPVMIYPSDYAPGKGINCEKQYYLWILDMQHGNAYMKYLGRTYRMKLV